MAGDIFNGYFVLKLPRATAITYLEMGGQLETADTAGDKVAFFWAAEQGSLGLLELQISRGIGIEDRSSEGRTALQLAAGCGHMSIVGCLLHKGAKVDAAASPVGGEQRFRQQPKVGICPLWNAS